MQSIFSYTRNLEDNIFFLEFDTIKVLDFNGNLVYEHDMERGIDSVIRHSQIEINDNIVYVSDTIDNSIKIPGTNQKIGIDAIVGIIPILGDFIGAIFSTYILYSGIKMGVYARWSLPKRNIPFVR